MGQHRKKDDLFWKKEFGLMLRKLFEDVYKVDYQDFAKKYYVSDSTIRYWLMGRNLPQHDFLRKLMIFFDSCPQCDAHIQNKFYRDIQDFFTEQNMISTYTKLKIDNPAFSNFVNELLVTYYLLAKGKLLIDDIEQTILPSGKTKAVVFDFDGTLTLGKTTQTTWESIWIKLGYDVKECQNLHQRFNNNEITHDEWCKLTEEKFIAKGLNKKMVLAIASKIRLIPGIKDTFSELYNRNIKIYIVSGSILTVIKNALGNRQNYVDEIKANEFAFDRDNKLIKINGTKYDFQGKATFIKQISQDMKIAPQDILFIGNSLNDHFAYLSGAITLCINPKLTDPTDRKIWNYCIWSCNNLTDILNYIDKEWKCQSTF